MTDFRYTEKRTHTALAGHIWDLKDKGIQFTVEWKFLKQVASYSPTSEKCNLCLTEKYFIIFERDGATLNQRSEFTSACRHRAKFLLKSS